MNATTMVSEPLPSPTALPIHIPGLDHTFGAYLLGTFISTALFGVTCLQTFMYYTSYPADKVGLKLMVGVLLVLETLHSIFNIHGCYHYFVINYFHPPALLLVVWSAIASVPVTVIIIFVVRTFYVHRLYIVSKKNWKLTIFMMVLVVAATGTGITYTVIGYQSHYLKDLVYAPLFYAKVAFTLAVTTDTLTAVLLTYYLHKGRTGRRRSDTLINRLIILTVNNGTLTTVLNVVSLVFVFSQPAGLVHFATYMVVGNTYTNSMLATLNARNMLRDEQVRLQELSNMQIRFQSDQSSSRPSGTTTTFLPTSDVENVAFGSAPPKTVPGPLWQPPTQAYMSD
ncbi:hypothetical protein BDV98DRAFT_606972 [Pterulicium gracile]|uniref:DUF6534 domain-containing protein n=1 Tax=Pterulicium gracile TaxID=1884261 RepID=A0A5C3QDB1_9AGAR|nr:hypothetical protein BDV98DRAFT_606972 [Pterula gracilis]